MSHSAVCACTLNENDLLDYAAEEKSFWFKKKKKRQKGNEERQEGGSCQSKHGRQWQQGMSLSAWHAHHYLSHQLSVITAGQEEVRQ